MKQTRITTYLSLIMLLVCLESAAQENIEDDADLQTSTQSHSEQALTNEIDPVEYLTRSETNLKVNKPDVVERMIIDNVLETPYVDTAKKVYDFAGLLSDQEEKLLKEKSQHIRNQYGMDIVILSINDNSLRSNSQYAQDFYDYNDFGADSIHSGFIISINMSKRRCDWWCEGKPHYAGFITSQEEYYSELVIPLLKKGQYYEAYDTLIDTFVSDYLYELQFPICKCIIFAAILTLIIILIARSAHFNRAIATNAHHYTVKDSFHLTNKKDVFSHTRHTKTYSPRQSSSSGGSSSSSGSGGGCSF